jgi:tricorn protease-like protein
VGEVPFSETQRLRRNPENPNDVPGPDSLRIVVRNTGHRPAIYLEGAHGGRSEQLLEKACGPRVSPDGKYVACTVWQSLQRPWTLVLLDLKTRQRIEPTLDGCSSPYVWSPDAKWIAVMVTPGQLPQSRLALVAIPSGRVQWIDSLSVFSDYEFEWSPDSRYLAVARPTEIDPSSEEPTASDVWIFSLDGRRKCLLAATPDYVEHEPRWISNSAIQVDRVRCEGGRFGDEDRVILEVSEGER